MRITEEQSDGVCASPKRTTNQVLYSGFFYVLLGYTLLLVLPVNYQTTMPYRDSSWGYGLNYFLHGNFRFGPDVIFTYGPLGFLNNPQHVGNDIAVALVVRLLFWIALGAQLLSIWKSGKKLAAVTFCISLAVGHRLYYDYWDYSLLALLLLTVIKLFRSAPSYLDRYLLPIIMAVSFLLKFTAFSMAVVMLAAYAFHSILHRTISTRLAAWLGICFLSGPVAYLIYSPSITNLVQYVRGAVEVSTGFATAMSLDNFPTNLVFAAILCFLLLFHLALSLWRRRLFWSEAILISLITWLVFRHGFVRGGYGDHSALFFGFSVLIFACLFMGSLPKQDAKLPFDIRFHEVILTVSFLLFNLIAFSGFAERYPVVTLSNWWPTQAFSDLSGLARWKETAYNLDHSSDDVFNTLPGMVFRNEVQGKRVLVFPNSTPYVAKIDFEMFPLYALQAYAAYTQYLDVKGAQKLTGARPPVDKVMLEWTTIDQRNPVLDTPAMYLAFFSHYMPERRVADALLLRRRPKPLAVHFTAIDRHTFQPDQWVQVPLRRQLVAMSIHLKQTFRGTLFTTLFCQDAVYLSLMSANGRVSEYRVPPQVLDTPGLINYVPKSLDEVEKIWDAGPLNGRIVQIRLLGPGLRDAVSDGYQFFEVEGLEKVLADESQAGQ